MSASKTFLALAAAAALGASALPAGAADDGVATNLESLISGAGKAPAAEAPPPAAAVAAPAASAAPVVPPSPAAQPPAPPPLGGLFDSKPAAEAPKAEPPKAAAEIPRPAPLPAAAVEPQPAPKFSAPTSAAPPPPAGQIVEGRDVPEPRNQPPRVGLPANETLREINQLDAQLQLLQKQKEVKRLQKEINALGETTPVAAPPSNVPPVRYVDPSNFTGGDSQRRPAAPPAAANFDSTNTPQVAGVQGGPEGLEARMVLPNGVRLRAVKGTVLPGGISVSSITGDHVVVAKNGETKTIWVGPTATAVLMKSGQSGGGQGGPGGNGNPAGMDSSTGMGGSPPFGATAGGGTGAGTGAFGGPKSLLGGPAIPVGPDGQIVTTARPMN